MATKSTPTPKNLETLGAARLAEILAEISAGNAVLTRRLRLELTAEESPAKLAHEIKKRLTALAARPLSSTGTALNRWRPISTPNGG